MKKNREMFSGLTAWLVSACFFLGCFANKQLLEKISKLGNSHILIYFYRREEWRGGFIEYKVRQKLCRAI